MDLNISFMRNIIFLGVKWDSSSSWEFSQTASCFNDGFTVKNFFLRPVDPPFTLNNSRSRIHSQTLARRQNEVSSVVRLFSIGRALVALFWVGEGWDEMGGRSGTGGAERVEAVRLARLPLVPCLACRAVSSDLCHRSQAALNAFPASPATLKQSSPGDSQTTLNSNIISDLKASLSFALPGCLFLVSGFLVFLLIIFLNTFYTLSSTSKFDYQCDLLQTQCVLLFLMIWFKFCRLNKINSIALLWRKLSLIKRPGSVFFETLSNGLLEQRSDVKAVIDHIFLAFYFFQKLLKTCRIVRLRTVSAGDRWSEQLWLSFQFLFKEHILVFLRLALHGFVCLREINKINVCFSPTVLQCCNVLIIDLFVM